MRFTLRAFAPVVEMRQLATYSRRVARLLKCASIVVATLTRFVIIV